MEPLLLKLSEHTHLRRWLETQFPEADEQTLRDTLEGLSSLPEMLACVVRSYLDDLTLVAALGHAHFRNAADARPAWGSAPRKSATSSHL